MLDEFNSFIEEHKLCRKEDHIILAISGGIDSMVMAHLFVKSGLKVSFAHCNFNLRGEDSDEDENFVKEMAAKYQVSAFSKKFDTEGFAEDNKMSIQLAARELRYNWFYELLKEDIGNNLATAHHLDDQFESLIYNITKGVGITGLSGIPIKNGNIIRPMLFASRDKIDEYARDNEITWREDASNKTVKYKRNFIRHEVVPLLKNINPSLLETFRRTNKRFREGKAIINESIDQFKHQHFEYNNNDDLFFDKNLLKEKNPTYVELLLSQFGINYSQAEDIVENLKNDNSGAIYLSENHKINIDREQVIISPLTFEFDEIFIESNVEGTLGQFEIKVIPKSDYKLLRDRNVAFLDYNKLDFPLKVRKWKEGDRFVPLGMRGQKKLSNFMIDSKIALNLKDRVLVIESGIDIIWVVGHRIDERYKITDTTKRVFKIKWLS